MQTKQIPARALKFEVSEIKISDKNGSGAKSAPVELKARSGQPVEHWYWGRVVHDLSGMKLNKNRIAIDYNHNADEVIGYLNKFDFSSGDLITSGALVPYKDSDRATEIIYKASEGVPYEASIFFGGDGIVIEEVDEGQTAQVNGYEFAGPGAIIREWPLRGVAICPYGQDANTEARFSEDENTVFNVKVKKGIDMKMNAEAVADEAVEAITTEGEETEQEETVTAEAEQEDTVDAELDEEQEDNSSDEEPAQEETVDTEMAVEAKPGAKYMEAFGKEQGAIWFAEDIAFEEAEKLFNTSIREERDALAKEVEALKKQIAELSINGAESVMVSAPESEKVDGIKRNGFMQICRDRAKSDNISLSTAMSIVTREMPDVYAEYRKTGK